jgi:hypothetical protein
MKDTYLLAREDHPLTEFFQLEALLAQEKMVKELERYKSSAEFDFRSEKGLFSPSSKQTAYDLNVVKDDALLFEFDAERMGPVDLFEWYHNTANHNWNKVIKKDYILLIEIPLYEKTHKIVNKISCNNEEKFVNAMLKTIKEKEKKFSIPALHSIYNLINCDKKPIIIGFSQRVNSGQDRELMVGRNLLQVTHAIQETIDRPLAYVVGNTHVKNVKYYVNNYSNLKLNESFSVGKPAIVIDDLYSLPRIDEECAKNEIILKLLEKTGLSDRIFLK